MDIEGVKMIISGTDAIIPYPVLVLFVGLLLLLIYAVIWLCQMLKYEKEKKIPALTKMFKDSNWNLF